MAGGGVEASALVRLVGGTALVGAAITTGVAVARSHPALGAERHRFGVLTLDDLHEGQVEAAAAMLLVLVAAVFWGRLRRMPTVRHLFLFAALCVLAVDNLISALFTAGFDSLAANRFATWSTAWNGLLGGVLLVTAAVVGDRLLARPAASIGTALAACGGLLVASMGTAWLLRGELPGAFDTRPTTPEQLTFLSEHELLFACEAVTALCWAVAGVAFTISARRTGDELTGWIGVASVLGAISFVNYALFPSQFTELLYLGDFFFLLAVAVLLVGAVREIGAAEAALVDTALHSERRRIAREMHDGVAQELALIAAEARVIARCPEASTGSLRRIRESVDRALDESRSSIKELSGPVNESLARAVEVTAQVVARRTGARIELDLDDEVVVSPDARLALMRITREVVVDATRSGREVTVQISLSRNGAARLRIAHDGAVAVDPDGDRIDGRPRLWAIREHGLHMGADVDVRADAHGTVVEVKVP